jgi:hypothetical protein
MQRAKQRLELRWFYHKMRPSTGQTGRENRLRPAGLDGKSSIEQKRSCSIYDIHQTLQRFVHGFDGADSSN